MKLRTYFFLIAAVFLVSLVPVSGITASTGNLAGKGHGVEVTMDFAQRVADFNQARSNVRPTPEEVVRSGVEHWLFAREAVKLGLAVIEEDINDMEPVQIVTLHNMYLAFRLMQVAPDERVLLSYYKAFPARFKVEQQADDEPGDVGGQDEPAGQNEPDMQEFDNDESLAEDEAVMVWIPFEDVRDDIRRALQAGKRTQVRLAAFEELVEKYEVQLNP